jgi:hypothetical protein
MGGHTYTHTQAPSREEEEEVVVVVEAEEVIGIGHLIIAWKEGRRPQASTRFRSVWRCIKVCVCVSVCVCVCVYNKGEKRNAGGAMERGDGYVCVCVCVFVYEKKNVPPSCL